MDLITLLLVAGWALVYPEPENRDTEIRQMEKGGAA
jgi:hypothetical protein